MREAEAEAVSCESPSLQAPSWMVFGLPGLALLLMTWVVLGHLNEPLFRFFNRLPVLTGPALWAHVTVLGDGLVCAVLFLPWLRRHPERVWAGLLGAVVMVIVLRLFKGLWDLPRPLGVLPENTVHVIGPGHRHSSFPSGHTATFALYAGVWALSTRRRWLSVLLVAPALLVGVSRMAVGVHWPADVLAGLALGWISAWLGLVVGDRLRWGRTAAGRRVLGALLLVAAAVLFLIDHTGYPGVEWFQRGVAAVGLLGGVWALVAMPGTGRAKPEARGPGTDGGARG